MRVTFYNQHIYSEFEPQYNSLCSLTFNLGNENILLFYYESKQLTSKVILTFIKGRLYDNNKTIPNPLQEGLLQYN